MRFNMQYDAQAAVSFLTAQTSHIETEVNRTVYPDILYPGLIPVDTSAHPFAQTVTYFSSDQFGAAKWINGNADDIPLAGTERSKFQTSVYMAGIGYGYGWEEIQTAQMQGVNLQADDALAARRAYEEMMDAVALQGDTEKGFQGLFSYSGVTVISAVTGAWDAGGTTEDQILKDINTLLLGVATATGYTSIADTLLLPTAKLNTLATKRITNTNLTVLEFMKQNNTYTAMTGRPLDIRGIPALITAGAGGVARAVAYRKSPQVLKMHVPMPHRFLPVFQDGPLHWLVPGVFRTGGLDIRRPAEVRYMDGL